MTHVIKEALWIHLFLTIHRLPIPQPFPLLCDNESAIALVELEAVSTCLKCIDVCYHFIWDHISDGSFQTTWIPTSDMTANIFTKPLLPPLFLKHHNALGLNFSLYLLYFIIFPSVLMGVCQQYTLLWSGLRSCDHSLHTISTSLSSSSFPQLSYLISWHWGVHILYPLCYLLHWLVPRLHSGSR